MFKPIALAGTFVVALTLVSLSLAPSHASAAAPPPKPPSAEKPAPPKEGTPTVADGQALIRAEKFDEAVVVFQAIVLANPDNANAWHLLGYSYHAGGKLTQALPCHLMAAEFEQTAGVSSYNVACVYSLRKKTDKAFAWLEKAKAAGFDNVEQIQGDTDMDNIRSDPRFAAFVKSLEHAAPDGPGAGAVVPAGGDKPKDPAKP